jgi:2-[(L-alanin-3-ylcarbamoyl)methyl]-2-hydroxybutanedioate decarboxylase
VELPPSAGGAPALPVAALPPHVQAALRERAGGDVPVGGYLYDPAVAAERARRLRAALPGWARVCYAVKANSYPPVLAALAPHVDGFEVASAAEAALAREHSPHGLMLAAGPGKTEPALRRLVELDVDVVNVESVLELHRLDRIAREAGRRVDVALRVNPRRVEVAGSLRMGGAATQFGIPEADVTAVLATAAGLPSVRVVGFHVHAVCNNLDAAAHAGYLRWCLDFAVRTAAAHGLDLRVIDIGGGLGVPFGTGPSFDVERFGELAAAVTPPPGCTVVLEPGRFLVTDCGWYAAEVTDTKHAYGTTFAVLRGGINHFQLPTSWDLLHNFAVLPVDDWPHPYARPEVSGPVTVVGELCTPEDTLARDVTVERLRAGDLVVFPMAGSYGWEFAMPRFLGHPPAERWTVTGVRTPAAVPSR